MAFLFAALMLFPLFQPHPLEGRIWDVRARAFIDADTAYARAAASRYVLLGERHDNAIHHRQQLDALRALTARGRRPALAMEQFDRERQASLAAAQAGGTRDPEALADAGGLNRQAWGWPLYKDLIAHAAQQDWPLLAANLSRADARAIALGKTASTLPAAATAVQTALEDDIINGHCGQRPPPALLAGLVAAQRNRDASLAAALDAAPDGQGAVLIAGAGHVRRDRAAPLYLKDADSALTIAYVEVVPGREAPSAYDSEGFDLLWFTAATPRPDPCATRPAGLFAGATTRESR